MVADAAQTATSNPVVTHAQSGPGAIPTAAAPATPVPQHPELTQAQRRAQPAPSIPGEVLYFAFGSNMCPSVFSGRRRVKPSASLPCMVPSHALTFDLLGVPYSEPGFATVLPLERAAQLAAARGEPPPHAVHGVLHAITSAEWVRVLRTEGVLQDLGSDSSGEQRGAAEASRDGGSNTTRGAAAPSMGYTVISVDCHLYDGRVVQALTLQGQPAALHGTERRVLPSARYLALLRNGAKAHGVAPEYRDYLASLEAYQPQHWGQTMGRAMVAAAAASTALALAPVALPAMAAAALVAQGAAVGVGAGAPAAGRATHAVLGTLLVGQGALWRAHDALLAPILGSGCSNE